MKKVIFLAMFLIGTMSVSAQDNSGGKPPHENPNPPGRVQLLPISPPPPPGPRTPEEQKRDEERKKRREEYEKAKQLIAK